MSPSNEQVRASIAEQAGAWFVENRGGALDREARARFVVWLRTSPTHVQEYLAVAVLARDLPDALDDPSLSFESVIAEARAEAGNIESLEPPRRPAAIARSRRLPVWLAAAAAVLVVACVALWTSRDGERWGLPITYRTAHGEQREQRLPDGSVVHLDTDSTITVRYSRAERLVALNRGQALFEVVHEGQRWFRVSAGAAGVVALGTQFDVYRHSAMVTVTVVEGSVAVFTGSTPATVPAGSLPEHSTRLGAGYQLDVRDQVGVPRMVDARATVGWLKRQITFDNQPLGEVAAEFNRYGSIAIEVDDEALRALPISGVFDPYDADSFAAFLETLNGVTVQRSQTGIRIVSPAPATPESPVAR